MSTQNLREATSAQTAAQLQQIMGISGQYKLKFCFHPNKVTAWCRYNNKVYGSKGASFTEAALALAQKLKAGWPPPLN